MSNQSNLYLDGMVLDERQIITMVEMCELCRVSKEHLNEMVEYGIIEPTKRDASAWQFSSQSLLRVKTAIRLQSDLEVNLAGAVLALDLLEEIKSLRQTVEFLQRG